MLLVALTRLNRHQEALEVLLSIDLKSNGAVLEDLYFLKAILYSRVGKEKEMMEATEELFKINPKNGFAVVAKVGDMLDSMHTRERQGTISMEEREKEYAEALKLLDAAIPVNEDNLRLYSLK